MLGNTMGPLLYFHGSVLYIPVTRTCSPGDPVDRTQLFGTHRGSIDARHLRSRVRTFRRFVFLCVYRSIFTPITLIVAKHSIIPRRNMVPVSHIGLDSLLSLAPSEDSLRTVFTT